MSCCYVASREDDEGGARGVRACGDCPGCRRIASARACSFSARTKSSQAAASCASSSSRRLLSSAAAAAAAAAVLLLLLLPSVVSGEAAKTARTAGAEVGPADGHEQPRAGQATVGGGG